MMTFVTNPFNLSTLTSGDDLKLTVDVDPKGKASHVVKFYRGVRELRDDSRVSISHKGNSSTLGIKRTRLTDEAKYTVNVESEGAITDTATFSVFIKGETSPQAILSVCCFRHGLHKPE